MSLNTSMLRPFSPETEADPEALADRLRSALSEPDAADYLRRAMAGLSQRPRWVPGAQELWGKGRVVRRFRHDADNQIILLAALQAAGWPSRIEDPLRRVARRNAKSRRRETVRSLNKSLMPGTIRFYSDGVGGIRWEEVV